MDDQLARYEMYARRVKRMLLFAGLWPVQISSKHLQIVVIFHVFTSIVTSSAIMNFVVSHITNLALVTKSLGIAVAFYTIILKVIVLSINRDNLVELHEKLETNFRKDLANPELRPVLLSPLEWFDRPSVWLSYTTWTVAAIYFSTPPISIGLQLAHGVSPIKYRLPFPSQYPWTIAGNSVLYPIQYIVEMCAGCANAGISVAVDALFGFYIFQMSSQLRTLSYRMNNLKSADDYHNVMKECAIRYRILTRCRDQLESIYGPIILWILVTSAISICANTFQATQISFGKRVFVMVHVIVKLLQALLYGWYGLILTNESENFREAVYFCGWPGTGVKPFMTDVCIMLMYKPLILTACHFSVISLDMFIAVSKTALSYFFLLRTLEEVQ